jgi:DNA-binding transcriptional LysR family regulator
MQSMEVAVDIRMLEAFVAVAEDGTFTRAAERLHLVQSSVSASVKSLERQLGFRLFDRGTRSVVLTAEGRSFLPYAKSAIAGVAEAKEAASALVGGVAGTVGVGVLAIPDMLGVADAIAHLHRQHPGIRINVRSALGGSAALQADVVAGELDLCFVVQPIRHPLELVVEPLVSGRYVLACGPQHAWAGRTTPVEPGDLNGVDFVEFPAGFSVREVTDAEFLARGIVRRPQVEVAHLDLIASYVAAGVGVGFVTEQSMRARPDLVRLEVPWFEMRWTVAVAWSRARPLSRAAATFLDRIREICRQSVAAGLLDPVP